MQIIAEFIEYLKEQGKSFNTIRLYKRDLLDFHEYTLKYINNFDIHKLNSETLNNFSSYLEKKNKTIAVINRKLTALHKFWIWLRDELREVEKDPFEQIIRKSQFRNKKIQTLNMKSMEHIFKTNKNIFEKLLIELIYNAGLKVKETLALTLDDFDNQSGTLQTNSRLIPLHPLSHQVLQEYIKECHDKTVDSNSKLLINPKSKNEKHPSEREIQRVIAKIGVQAGLDTTLTPSLLRQSLAKHLIDNGANNSFIKNYMGQKEFKV